MPSSSCLPTGTLSLRALCVRICVFYCTVCVAFWSSEALKIRCGSELLSDLRLVCGQRGIHFGRPPRYGARSRGKGIVDLCCKSSGCDLQQLEAYCAKPRGLNPPPGSSPPPPGALILRLKPEEQRPLLA
ncbi:insulin-like growth factor 1 [Menidia menidia]